MAGKVGPEAVANPLAGLAAKLRGQMARAKTLGKIPAIDSIFQALGGADSNVSNEPRNPTTNELETEKSRLANAKGTDALIDAIADTLVALAPILQENRAVLAEDLGELSQFRSDEFKGLHQKLNAVYDAAIAVSIVSSLKAQTALVEATRSFILATINAIILPEIRAGYRERQLFQRPHCPQSVGLGLSSSRPGQGRPSRGPAGNRPGQGRQGPNR